MSPAGSGAAVAPGLSWRRTESDAPPNTSEGPMTPNRPVEHRGTDADIAAAMATFLFNALPEILLLPRCEQYDRLRAYFEACLAAKAYQTGRAYPPRPSDN